jgi:lysophospholipase L1-like esterase
MRIVVAALIAMMAWHGGADAAETDDCAVSSQFAQADVGLPRAAAAMGQTQQLDIAVVGTGSSTLPGAAGAQSAYPARLQADLQQRLPALTVNVVTDVKSRRTTAEMAEGFDKLLMDVKPALVIWQTGTVDAMRGVAPEEFRATLEEGVETLHAGGADVVLMNMQYSPRTESMIAVDPYAEAIHSVAQQQEVPLFDRFAAMRHWSEAGTFDLYAATRDMQTAARVHGCIAQLLAGLIVEGIEISRQEAKKAQ